TSGSPYSTGWASSTRMRLTVPDRWAGIWFMVFIASMISTVWPSETRDPTSTNLGPPGSAARYAVPTIGEVSVAGFDASSSAGVETATFAPPAGGGEAAGPWCPWLGVAAVYWT